MENNRGTTLKDVLMVTATVAAVVLILYKIAMHINIKYQLDDAANYQIKLTN